MTPVAHIHRGRLTTSSWEEDAFLDQAEHDRRTEKTDGPWNVTYLACPTPLSVLPDKAGQLIPFPRKHDGPGTGTPEAA